MNCWKSGIKGIKGVFLLLNRTFQENKGVDVGIANIRLESDLDAKPGCDGR